MKKIVLTCMALMACLTFWAQGNVPAKRLGAVKMAHDFGAQINTGTDSLFIKGLSGGIFYRPQTDINNKGETFSYIPNPDSNDTLFVSVYLDQSFPAFVVRDKNNGKVRLPFDFNNIDIQVISQEERHLRKDVTYLIGQYDFNEDGVNELIVATKAGALGIFGDEMAINVFFYNSGVFSGEQMIATNLYCDRNIAQVKRNTIIIPRCHRGIYYEWDYKNGRFYENTYAN